MGAPLRVLTAPVVTFIELVSDLMLIVRAFRVISGALLVIDMVAGFFITHAEHGFFATNGGFELVMLLALVIVGPGRYSVDAMLPLPGAGLLTVGRVAFMGRQQCA